MWEEPCHWGQDLRFQMTKLGSVSYDLSLMPMDIDIEPFFTMLAWIPTWFPAWYYWIISLNCKSIPIKYFPLQILLLSWCLFTALKSYLWYLETKLFLLRHRGKLLRLKRRAKTLTFWGIWNIPGVRMVSSKLHRNINIILGEKLLASQAMERRFLRYVLLPSKVLQDVLELHFSWPTCLIEIIIFTVHLLLSSLIQNISPMLPLAISVKIE